MQVTKDMAKEAKNLNNYFLGDLRQDEKRLSRTGRYKNDFREEISDYCSIEQYPLPMHNIRIVFGSSVFDADDGKTKYLMFLARKKKDVFKDPQGYVSFGELEKALAAEQRLNEKIDKKVPNIKRTDSHIYGTQQDGYRVVLTITAPDESLHDIGYVLSKNGILKGNYKGRLL